MSGLITAIGTGVTTFSATNIDDIVILMLFFSRVNPALHRRHIVVGQYLGFTALILISIPSFFGGLIIPRPLIGLFGLLPILIGLKCLMNCEEESKEIEDEKQLSPHSQFTFLNLQTSSVAAVTIANGIDNISIYVPLFASSTWHLLIILGVFFILVGVLCYAAYKLTCHQAIAELLTHYGNKFMPFVLVGLGAFIVVDSGTLTLINLFNV